MVHTTNHGTVTLKPNQRRDDLEFSDGEMASMQGNRDLVFGDAEPAAKDAPAGQQPPVVWRNPAVDVPQPTTPAAAPPAAGSMSLAEAVASLDKANDGDWTSGGKPNLDVLRTKTGNTNLSRADVDATGAMRA